MEDKKLLTSDTDIDELEFSEENIANDPDKKKKIGNRGSVLVEAGRTVKNTDNLLID